jgi:hypothetical protein
VALEPSTAWARGFSPAQAQAENAKRVINFNFSFGDFVLRYAAETWLCPGAAFLLTDLGRCSVSNGDGAADRTRSFRYQNCAPYLEEELRIFKPRAVIGIGRLPASWLRRQLSDRYQIEEILHYSTQARWKARLLLTNSGYPGSSWRALIEPTLTDLTGWLANHSRDDKISESALLLLAAYRLQFEAIRAHSAPGA